MHYFEMTECPRESPLVPIVSTFPFEIVSIDYMHLDQAKGGYAYALVLCDHFTKFVHVYAMKNKSVLLAAEKIFNEYILKVGFPVRIHHDQRKEFNNMLFKRLHQLAGIASSCTTPYHPIGDEQTECINQTIIGMLKTLEEKEKFYWKDHLAMLAFTYNSTVHKTTGFSPYFLMFGREPRLLIDMIFGKQNEVGVKLQKSYQRNVKDWENAMNQAFEIWKEHSGKTKINIIMTKKIVEYI